MIIVLRQDITQKQKDEVKSLLKENGLIIKEIKGKEDTVLGAVGVNRMDPRQIELMDGVASVVPISKPYKLASRELKKEDTIVRVGDVRIGGNRVVMMAGPCAVESEKQIMEIAETVRRAGAVILRGGAFKPRTSPYSFQGLGEEGLKYLRKAGDEFGMPVTTEVVSPKDVEMMAGYIDMFQIGARNMQNFELLKEVGKTGMPVLLQRGLAATIEEWLMAAEYLMANGTDQVVLCERGIRTYEKATRNTLDCSAIPVVQKLTHLPVIGDPSHATGMRDLVSPMGLALVAAGAFGLIVEVHNHPDKALSDGPQSLLPEQFEKLVRDVEALCPVVGKSLESVPRIIPSSMREEEGRASSNDGLTVAFQGERGAFSELAVRNVFPEEVSVLPCKSFHDAFEAVNKGKAKYAVLPIENTLGGTIVDNIDLLGRYPNITIVGEVQVRIIHDLIVNPGVRMEDIKKVYSHPQGLAQCHDFLDRELPDAERIPFFDTAGAVSYINQSGDRSAAAIAGAPAAAYHGMEVLRQSRETNPRNYTRFFVLTRSENAAVFRSANVPDRVAVSFTVPDRPGALFDALEVFKAHSLNMKKLESRPIAGKPWEYSFFAELELSSMEKFDEALTQLKEQTSQLSVLGSYKRAH